MCFLSHHIYRRQLDGQKRHPQVDSPADINELTAPLADRTHRKPTFGRPFSTQALLHKADSL